MTYEEKIEFLKSYKNIERAMEKTNLEIEEFRLAKMCPSAKIGDGMPHGSNTSDLSDYAAELDAKIRKLLKLNKQRQKALINITDSINTLSDQIEQDVLFHHYILDENWSEVAEYIQYSESQTYEYRNRAIKNLQVIGAKNESVEV